MPIRICRACALGLAAASLWFVAACTSGTAVRSEQAASAGPPEASIERAEKALAERDYPAAARAYLLESSGYGSGLSHGTDPGVAHARPSGGLLRHFVA